MAKVMIEMEPEQVDAILISELKWHIETFSKDLELREKVRVCLYLIMTLRLMWFT